MTATVVAAPPARDSSSSSRSTPWSTAPIAPRTASAHDGASGACAQARRTGAKTSLPPTVTVTVRTPPPRRASSAGGSWSRSRVAVVAPGTDRLRTCTGQPGALPLSQLRRSDSSPASTGT